MTFRRYTKLLLTLFVAFTGTAFAEARDKQSSTEIKEEAYFRHMMFRESPYSPYRGIYPLDKKQTANTAHYVFEYDEKGRITSIAHKIGDTIIADNGNWDSFIWFAPKVTITYAKDKEVHHYFNHENQPIEAHGKVFKAEYRLHNGQRKSLTFFDKANDPSESEWQVNRYDWSIDEQQRIVEKRYNLKNEQVSLRPQFKFYETRMAFDDDGKVAFMYNYGLEGKPTNNDSGAGIDRIFYDHNGNFSRWHVYDKDGNPVEGNNPMVHIGEHLYDEFGNKVMMRGFDRKGAEKAFAWGHLKMVNTYDRFGNQTANIAFDTDGQQVTHAVVEYSQDGLRREWIRFLDTEGNLVNAPQLGGAAALQFTYDQGNRTPTGRVFFNAEMEKVEG